jgi:hypothetical protein
MKKKQHLNLLSPRFLHVHANASIFSSLLRLCCCLLYVLCWSPNGSGRRMPAPPATHDRHEPAGLWRKRDARQLIFSTYSRLKSNLQCQLIIAAHNNNGTNDVVVVLQLQVEIITKKKEFLIKMNFLDKIYYSL